MYFDPNNDIDCNALLEYNGATLQWDLYDTKVIKYAGKNNVPDGEWRLNWKSGTITLGGNKENVQDGKNRAALFIYLWQLGVECSLAIDLAVCYFKISTRT